MYSSLCELIQTSIPGGCFGLLTSCAAIVLVILGSTFLSHRRTLRRARKKISEKQSKARGTIDQIRAFVNRSKVELSIVDLSFVELRHQLQVGKLKPSQVLLSYQAKALQVHGDLNCITEFITDAQLRASQLDTIDKKERGPLYGIPVSLKEAVGLQGCDCNSGCINFMNKIYCEDSVVVKALKQLGAVPFCRTNLSQAQMSLSCRNPIYGETRNPIQSYRTCGGSTGGEGALIGGGGSVLGVGCDMGGSIRVPAHFCGIVGVKGTPRRISSTGNFPLGQEIVTVAEVFGPLGRDVESVVAFFSSMLSFNVCCLDPLIPPVPWRQEIYSSTTPMTIGFYINDGCVEPVPAVVRAVNLAKTILTRLGHTVVEFSLPDVMEVMENLYVPIMFGDQCQTIKESLSQEIIIPDVKELMFVMKQPLWIRKLLSKIVYSLHPLSKALIRAKLPGSVASWWKLNGDLEHYTRKFVGQWQNLEMDGLICPAYPFTAWPLDNDKFSSLGLTYQVLYNLLGYPCGVLPATVVTAEDVLNMKHYPNRNIGDKYIQQISKASEGLPVGVQCIALPFQEEKLLRLMKLLETGFKSESC